MNFDQLSQDTARDDDARPLEILQRNGEPFLAADGTPSTVSVVGPYSKRVQSARDALQRRQLRRRQTKLEPADLLANRIELAAAAITDWSGWESGGQPVPFSPENAKALLRSSLFILEQVEAGVASHADFFASKSS